MLPAGLGVSGEPRLCRRKRIRAGGSIKFVFFTAELCFSMVSEGRVFAGMSALVLHI